MKVRPMQWPLPVWWHASPSPACPLLVRVLVTPPPWWGVASPPTAVVDEMGPSRSLFCLAACGEVTWPGSRSGVMNMPRPALWTAVASCAPWPCGPVLPRPPSTRLASRAGPRWGVAWGPWWSTAGCWCRCSTRRSFNIGRTSLDLARASGSTAFVELRWPADPARTGASAGPGDPGQRRAAGESSGGRRGRGPSLSGAGRSGGRHRLSHGLGRAGHRAGCLR